MVRIGVSVSDQELKTLERYLRETFYYVITVCDESDMSIFPGEEPTPLVLRGPFSSDRKRRGATRRI